MKSILLIITFLFLQSAIVLAEDVPDYIGKYANNPEEIKAINKVIEDFQRAIKEHDGNLLKSLLMNENIVFFPPPPQMAIDWVRKEKDADFMKKYPSPGGAISFIKFISESKDQIEERFFNIRIIQDTDYALVVFDYDFRKNEVASNYGIETWQLAKIDEKWKIVTVMWSVNRLGEPMKIPE